jgi:hypothetical protein
MNIGLKIELLKGKYLAENRDLYPHSIQFEGIYQK